MKVFISYKSENRYLAQYLRNQIRAWGCCTWLDCDDIPTGGYFRKEIQKGLELSDVVVGIMTPEALASREVMWEWDYALRNSYLIPLKYSECSLPYHLQSIQYIDFTLPEAQALEHLKDILISPKALSAWTARLQPPQTESISPIGDRNRSRMLQRVSDFWITSVLDNLLHDGHAVDLDLAIVPHAVLRHVDYGDYTLLGSADVLQIFEDLNREMLILGTPGSGKTTLMLRLAHKLIARAQGDPSQPIPAVFNLSSWGARREVFAAWLIHELRAKYLVPNKVAKEWVNHEQLLLLLDGLDEVAEPYRATCIEAINRFRDHYRSVDLVVCCRTQEYEAVISKLNLRGAIELKPLAQSQIDRYLALDDLAGLRSVMEADETLREMAHTPFLLHVLASAYSNEKPITLRLPLNESDAAGRRNHLFETYIEKKLLGIPTHYTASQTRRQMTWLATTMAARQQTVFSIEDLQPDMLSGRGSQLSYDLSNLATIFIFGLLLVLLSLVALEVLDNAAKTVAAAPEESQAAVERADLEELAVSVAIESYRWTYYSAGEFENEIYRLSSLLGTDQATVQAALEQASVNYVDQINTNARYAVENATTDIFHVCDFESSCILGVLDDSERSQGWFGPYIEDALVSISLDDALVNITNTPADDFYDEIEVIEGMLSQKLLAEAIEGISDEKGRDASDARARAVEATELAEAAPALLRTNQILIILSGIALFPFSLSRLMLRRVSVIEALPLSLRGAFLGGLFTGLLTGYIILSDPILETRTAAFVLLAFSTSGTLFGALLGGRLRGQPQIDVRVIPNQGIWRSVNNAILIGILFGVLALALNITLFGTLASGVGVQKAWVAIPAWSLVVVLHAALFFGGAAVIKHGILRVILLSKGDISWNYAQFLDSAAMLGILRKVGGGYIFIHRYLLEYFVQTKC